MTPRFQLVLFTLHFLCSHLGMFTRPVVKNSVGAPSSAKGGTRCVCLAALASTAAHRLQLGFGRGDHSHPCGGSSSSGCYQQRRQAAVVSTRAAAAVGKVGGLHLARVNFLLQPPPTTHRSHSEGFCVLLVPWKNCQNETILEEENFKNMLLDLLLLKIRKWKPWGCKFLGHAHVGGYWQSNDRNQVTEATF